MNNLRRLSTIGYVPTGFGNAEVSFLIGFIRNDVAFNVKVQRDPLQLWFFTFGNDRNGETMAAG